MTSKRSRRHEDEGLALLQTQAKYMRLHDDSPVNHSSAQCTTPTLQSLLIQLMQQGVLDRQVQERLQAEVLTLREQLSVLQAKMAAHEERLKVIEARKPLSDYIS